jgi:prepilin-type N-terminal cleavage/methylation domain-containing protein
VTTPRKDPQAGVTLVELLVVIVIMGVVSTMLVGVWFALTNASAFSSTSSQQQDNAREAVARMSREIRDAQAPTAGNAGAFVLADPYQIEFYSTFNDVDAENPSSVPQLTRFIYKETDSIKHIGAIYREKYDGGAWGSSVLLVDHVVNKALSPNATVFTYTAFGDSGVYQSDGTTSVPAGQIVDVTISTRVDLNPGHSPNYVTLQTTVQPRNMLQL